MREQPIPPPDAFACRLVSLAPAATFALGERAASLLHGGESLLLWGLLGAGKTLFVQGLCRGLGVADEVVSPTFNLACRYAGRLVVHHLDFYRLDQGADLADVGVDGVLEEVDAGGAVLVAEWPLPVVPLVPRRVELLATPGPGAQERIWHARGYPSLPAPWRALFAEGARC